MSTRRTVLGRYNDGVTVGLRCSLPGFDGLTGDSNAPGQFSFDSEWTDIVQIHQAGIATNPGGSGAVTATIPFVDPGYRPFVEVRWMSSSNVIYDDYFAPPGAAALTGIGAQVNTNSIVLPTAQLLGGGPFTSVAYNVLYIVYRIPSPL